MVLESLVAPLASFLGPAAPLPAPVPQFHGVGVVRTSLYAGSHWLTSDFAPADEQLVFGIGLDVREPAAKAGFEAGYFNSSAEESTSVGAGSANVESLVHEVWGGARWTFEPWFGRVQPYVGTGFSALYASYDVDGFGGTTHGSSWALGIYGHAGLEWTFAGQWAVGLDLRTLLSTEAELQANVTLNYTQAALTLSWGW